MNIRPETFGDLAAIRRTQIEAFKTHPYSHQTEHLIVEALRDAGALELSLVAELDGEVVGHVAFSLGAIGKARSGWYVLGPIGVLPEHQRHGIGSALAERGLEILRSRGASGCVLVGDPGYYRRFGFKQVAGVVCEGVPDENVLCLAFEGEVPLGEMWHNPGFWVGQE